MDPTQIYSGKPLLEDWLDYTEDLTAPHSFITMSFYYMIGAALQRRVWVGGSHMPIFPNQYIIMVGDPGVGKGITIKPTTELMITHKLKPLLQEVAPKTKIDPKSLATIEDYIAEIKALKGETKPTSYIKEDPLLFPVPADATTYRALVNANANCHRFFKVPNELKHLSVVPPSGIYGHSSLCFLLEELSSLFKKFADDIVNYLLVAWDCGDYTYATQHQGVDKVRKTCLSMLAGTTPGFMRDIYSDKLVSEGFSARTIFVCEDKPRFTRFGIPDLSPKQEGARLKILGRLKELSTLFGQAIYTQEAHDYFKQYFEIELPAKRINTSPKLIPYYSKKVQHAQKLAMAIHFADSNSMTIGIDACRLSLEILASLEGKMHYALVGGGKTPQGNNTRRLVDALAKSTGPMNLMELWKSLEGDAKDIEIVEIMSYLEKSGQIEKCGKLEWTAKKKP